MSRIIIIDYNMGNLHSVAKALQIASGSADFEIKVTNDLDSISEAKGIILPGVGAFGKGMENLGRFGLIDILKEKIYSGIPILGICLGMQLLFSESEEYGKYKGLNLIEGRVIRFPEKVKIPHMGWNQVKQISNERSSVSRPRLFKNIPDNSYFYFVHSYYIEPEDKNTVVATTEYGVRFASAVQKGNIIGVQFHPEKSQDLGIRLLENFVEIVKGS